MSLELYLQYGIPTLFLVVGLVAYAIAKLDSRWRGRRR